MKRSTDATIPNPKFPRNGTDGEPLCTLCISSYHGRNIRCEHGLFTKYYELPDNQQGLDSDEDDGDQYHSVFSELPSYFDTEDLTEEDLTPPDEREIWPSYPDDSFLYHPPLKPPQTLEKPLDKDTQKKD